MAAGDGGALKHCLTDGVGLLTVLHSPSTPGRCGPAPARWPLAPLRPFQCPATAGRGFCTVGDSAQQSPRHNGGFDTCRRDRSRTPRELCPPPNCAFANHRTQAPDATFALAVSGQAVWRAIEHHVVSLIFGPQHREGFCYDGHDGPRDGTTGSVTAVTANPYSRRTIARARRPHFQPRLCPHPSAAGCPSRHAAALAHPPAVSF